jgi:putative inorganic carbon (hco3(-)) transporter
MQTRIAQRIARSILWLEPLLLGLITLAFWYPTPTRTDWLWLLWLLLPVYGARYVAHRRLFTRTPLDLWFAAFLILGAANVWLAPYTRGLMMLARPVLGMALFYALVERARQEKSLRSAQTVVTLLALLAGLLALGATQWNPFKTELIAPIVDSMPVLWGFPGAERGFNANEIAGGLIWLIPLVVALTITSWQQNRTRWALTLASLMLVSALMLGQSRAAIIGLLLVLPPMILLLYRSWPWRLIGLGGIALLIGFQLVINADLTARSTRPVETPATEAAADTAEAPVTASYDDRSFLARIDIWRSAVDIIRDYPLTGVGLSMFRDGRVRQAYPVPQWQDTPLPHAHNVLLQIGADLGLPGLLVYIGFYGVTGRMLWRAWQQGDAWHRAWSIGVAGGLLAHLAYGAFDTVTLWDRLAFIFWLLLGLAGAVYVSSRQVAVAAADNAAAPVPANKTPAAAVGAEKRAARTGSR